MSTAGLLLVFLAVQVCGCELLVGLDKSELPALDGDGSGDSGDWVLDWDGGEGDTGIDLDGQEEVSAPDLMDDPDSEEAFECSESGDCNDDNPCNGLEICDTGGPRLCRR